MIDVKRPDSPTKWHSRCCNGTEETKATTTKKKNIRTQQHITQFVYKSNISQSKVSSKLSIFERTTGSQDVTSQPIHTQRNSVCFFFVRIESHYLKRWVHRSFVHKQNKNFPDKQKKKKKKKKMYFKFCFFLLFVFSLSNTVMPVALALCVVCVLFWTFSRSLLLVRIQRGVVSQSGSLWWLSRRA